MTWATGTQSTGHLQVNIWCMSFPSGLLYHTIPSSSFTVGKKLTVVACLTSISCPHTFTLSNIDVSRANHAPHPPSCSHLPSYNYSIDAARQIHKSNPWSVSWSKSHQNIWTILHILNPTALLSNTYCESTYAPAYGMGEIVYNLTNILSNEVTRTTETQMQQ